MTIDSGPFTLSGPDQDNLVWLTSGEGLREEMRERLANLLIDIAYEGFEEAYPIADAILSLPGISTSYGINLGEKADVAEILSQWLGSIDYGEDQ